MFPPLQAMLALILPLFFLPLLASPTTGLQFCNDNDNSDDDDNDNHWFAALTMTFSVFLLFIAYRTRAQSLPGLVTCY